MNSRELINEYSIRPNKALGQNFLVDEAAILAIAECAAEPGLAILEIGPGLGALTLPMAERAPKVAAVELDRAMCEVLRGIVPDGTEIINEDFLKCDLEGLHELLGGGEISVAANLPYYVTSPIVQRLVLSGLPIRRMTLMMQKEAAERFTAEPGDRNYVPLTVLTRRLFDARELLELGPNSYYPQPEVASKVLVFERNGANMPKKMPSLVKCAFAMRRKTLQNNLCALGLTKAEAAELIEACGLEKSVRAETLSCEEFVKLAEKAEEIKD